MKVLHVEDYDSEKGKDFAKALSIILSKDNVECKNVEYYSDLVKLNALEYEMIILDGQFPESAGAEPDVATFQKALQFLINSGINTENIIVWSNSTRVHSYCFEKGIKYFSKKDMKKDDYVKKNVNPKAIAKKASEEEIAEEVMKDSILK